MIDCTATTTIIALTVGFLQPQIIGIGASLSLREEIKVELGQRSYHIVVHAGAIKNIGDIDELKELGHVIVISDENVSAHYLKPLRRRWKKLAERVDSVVVAAGEKSKSIKQIELLWNRLLDLETDRKSTIIALGGGVVGDLAGFAAASFARGLDFIQMPTSLLAQVDSSVGGKVGINLPKSKNMVGAFWQPKFVLIDPTVLDTLDNANFAAGLAEVVKYGVIMDAEFFAWLEQNVSKIIERNVETLTQLIATCCQLKADVVAEDETEATGRRAILNYGHTFGHAIENVFGYGQYLHGEAISIGMHCAARLAFEQQLIDNDVVKRQADLLTAFGLPLLARPGKESELVAAMHRDKKVVGGKLKLVLPTKLGGVDLFDAPNDEVLTQTFLSN